MQEWLFEVVVLEKRWRWVWMCGLRGGRVGSSGGLMVVFVAFWWEL